MIDNVEFEKHTEVKQRAERDLAYFIQLVHPLRALGRVHLDLINWMTREEQQTHQLILLPRDHQKSTMIAYRVVWELTRNPALRVIYLSSTANLATKQLKFMKDIFLSDNYRRYWPNMVAMEEGKREKWTESEISLDHPKRKKESIRDPSIFTGGLTTSFVGMHCDIAVLDDAVVPENAYTQEGRTKVKEQHSYLASVESVNSKEWVVGTRYHPLDLYGEMLETKIEIFGEDGEVEEEYMLYETFKREVENKGDGTGEFIWPLQVNKDGKTFGFDKRILAKKKGQYAGNATQFRAQYYNDPSALEDALIPAEFFQYYERGHLGRADGKWYIKGRRLNVFAAIDFAFSLRQKADYSSIVVIGVDAYQNYYILEIDRFKTDRISEYFDHILRLHTKWDFRKIRAEVTVGQQVIVKDLKENYIRTYGLALSVDEFRPNRHEGTKEERIFATLQPKYMNRQVYHYQGGNCQALEEELNTANSAHDDIKDALTAAMDIAVPPSNNSYTPTLTRNSLAGVSHPRFGGLA